MVTSLFEVCRDVRSFRSCRLRAVSTQLCCFEVNVLQLGRFHLLALLWRLLKEAFTSRHQRAVNDPPVRVLLMSFTEQQRL